MVFSSVPVYLDPPNWQQQQFGNQNHQNHHAGVESLLQQLPLVTPGPSEAVPAGGGTGGGLIRPVSMADRARMAKMPQLETAPLKCPRCDSTNTKFCYYNNYSLSQPRHFCKTCRRYWTRGGALRNVPVGGGCRRNKKNKTSSKSSSEKIAHHHQIGSVTTTTTNTITITSSGIPTNTPTSNEIILPNLSSHHQVPFMSSLGYNYGNHLGLNFAQIGGPSSTNDQIGSSTNTNTNNSTTIFPNFFEPNTSVFNFHNEGIDGGSNSRVSPIKMEDNNQGLNLARPFFSPNNTTTNNNNQYWSSGSTWMDLSGLNSSSTNHML